MKLSALPDRAADGAEDWTEATAVVLGDIDRLLGSDFGTRFSEIYGPDDFNRTWQSEDDEVAEGVES